MHYSSAQSEPYATMRFASADSQEGGLHGHLSRSTVLQLHRLVAARLLEYDILERASPLCKYRHMHLTASSRGSCFVVCILAGVSYQSGESRLYGARASPESHSLGDILHLHTLTAIG